MGCPFVFVFVCACVCASLSRWFGSRLSGSFSKDLRNYKFSDLGTHLKGLLHLTDQGP